MTYWRHQIISAGCPGSPCDGDDPRGYMLRDEIVAYIERYAASFDSPYRGGIEAIRANAWE